MSDSENKPVEENTEAEAVVEQIEATESVNEPSVLEASSTEDVVSDESQQDAEQATEASDDNVEDGAEQDLSVADQNTKDGIEGEAEEQSEQTSMEALTELMLDSAEAANLAADSANSSSELIIGSVAAFNQSMESVQKKQTIMFWVLAGLLIVFASVSLVLMERFTQSAAQADEIMLTVGKRVVQMDTDVKRMAQLRKEINTLNETNVVLNMQVTEAIGLMGEFEKDATKREESGIERTTELLDTMSNRLDVKFEKFSGVVAALEEKVNRNAIRIEQMGDELSELSISVGEMKDQKLIDKLNALIKLEQNRYYELMNGKTPQTNESTSLRYPVKGKTAINKEECVPRLGFPCP